MELYAKDPEDVGAVQNVFWTAHRKLREKSDLTVEYASMHQANMVWDVVAWLHESLQQEQVRTETPAVVQAPVDHVANKMKKKH